MDKVLRLIVENTASGRIEKNVAAELVHRLRNVPLKSGDDIAVIGMSANFPHAKDINEYWNNIILKTDCIANFPGSRRSDIGSYPSNYMNIDKDKVKFVDGAYLENIDKFDYGYFKLSPKEASLMDPAQRLFMQTVLHAAEDAGYGSKRLYGTRTGIYVAYASNAKDSYHKIIYDTDPSSLAISIIGNIVAMIPTRMAYFLDLKGPTMVIDTACSASLVSIHLACQALKDGECDMAIAGGIKINLLPLDNEDMKIGIESSDFRTWAFDASADGAGSGEGIAAVILKPLLKALKDGDNIHAVIKGSSLNQDGASMGITAPNPASQVDVITRAWEDAGINPETLSYIEAHGTGTGLGDPIEIDSLEKAFDKYTKKKQFCAIGSVKTNVGHLYECAGAASFIKAVMALKNKKIPPTINFVHPNKRIDFNNSPVFVNTETREWEKSDHPRRCGINAFGLSGTNCHMILEEAPPRKEKNDAFKRDWDFIALCARSEETLREIAANYSEFISEHSKEILRDLCYTTNTGRGDYSHRLVIFLKSSAELETKLATVLKSDFEKLDEPWFYYGVHRNISDGRETKEGNEITDRVKAELTDKASLILENMKDLPEPQKDLMDELFSLYVKGAQVDWIQLYQNMDVHKISAPVYPFERKRCWLQVPDTVFEEIPDYSEEGLYYELGWKVNPVIYREAAEKTGSVLIFMDERGMGRELSDIYGKDGRTVVEVEKGTCFEICGNNRFKISGSEEDYDRLVQSIKETGVSQIIHLFTLTPSDNIKSARELELNQKWGVYSLFYLTRAIERNRLGDEIDIMLVTEYVNGISGKERLIKPENATLTGLGKVVGQEYSHINVKALDIDEGCSAEDIIREIEIKGRNYQVAIRDGVRYAEEFREVNPEGYPENNLEIKEDGVYVITGGSGGIGQEIARYFSKGRKVKLVFINRRKMPDRDEWDRITGFNEDKKLCALIETVREIESGGTAVEFYSADAADINSMKSVLESIRENHGRINGIIHSAGIAGAGYMIMKDENVFSNVLAPKVTGTWALDMLTEKDDLDFLILFSSGAAVTGEAGQGDYVAANSYMDSYSTYRNRKGKRTLTIDWVSWKSAGMSVEFGINIDAIFKALPTDKALKGFDNVIGRNISRVLIGEMNYKSEFISAFESLPFELSDKIRILAAKNSKQIESGSIKNGDFEMAVLENGKLKLLPRGKKSVRIKDKVNVRLKGKENVDYSEIEEKLAVIYSNVLGFEEINIHDSFFELGGDSVLLSRMHTFIEKQFPGKVKLIDLFEYTSISKLASFIAAGTEEKIKSRITGKSSKNGNEGDIAIIGIGLKLPQADNIDEFWNGIINAEDMTRHFPEKRRRLVEDYLTGYMGIPGSSLSYAEGAYLDGIDEFDFKFFRLSPKEASLMEPGQRMFLQTVWQAIEDAGYGGDMLAGTRTGVYVGFAANNYYQRMVYDVDSNQVPISLIGNVSAVMPSRISYLLDLKGPTMVIDTACSASLVSVHTACRAIHNGDCDMALAGGVKINMFPVEDENMKIGIESSDFRTRTFDESADGTGTGEGIAVVFLKPLERAIKDGDNIHAVIKGSAINQDGSSIGITAPNQAAQTDVLTRAWEDAGVDPETIKYIEAHGTATNLGDPIEIEGIRKAFEKYTDKKQFCAISALKTNIGHLYECAGVAGLIKAVMSLKNGVIPPSVNFERPNKKVDFSDSPVFINTNNRKWPENEGPRRCGVSAFGLSGTNCHVVLEEAPEVNEKQDRNIDGTNVLVLSAKSEASLYRLLDRYLIFAGNNNSSLREICHTAAAGRGHYNYRLAMIVDSIEELKDRLKAIVKGKLEDIDEPWLFYGIHFVKADNDNKTREFSITEKEKKELTHNAARKLEEYIGSGRTSSGIYEELCRLYIKGADISWTDFHGEDIRKTSLPAYPFEPYNCWLEIPEREKDASVEAEQADIYYELGWIPEILTVKDAGNNKGPVLILKDKTGKGNKLAAYYKELGQEVIEVETGSKYSNLSDSIFSVSQSEDDYERLVEAVKGRGLSLVVHLFTVNENKSAGSFSELNESQSNGLFSLMYLSKALIKCRVPGNINIVLVSDYVNEVDRSEKTLKPENATFFGLGKVVGQEYSNLIVRAVDIDDRVSTESLAAEMDSCSPEYQVAYRNGTRYVEIFREVNKESLKKNDIGIRENGVYLITGGLGGIGLEMAGYLASKKKVRLAFMQRTMMPLPSEWDTILLEGKDPKMCRRIRAIREIEDSGSEVKLYCADVSDYEKMSSVIGDIKNDFGGINGIIHAAGIAGPGYLLNKDMKVFNRVFNPKVMGTWILDQLTEKENMDFFVVFSSTVTITGEAGQGDYVAANSYLDSFSAMRSRQGKRTLTLNWCAWKSAGMSVEFGINTDAIFKALPTDKAVSGFHELIGLDINRVIVGELNFESEFASVIQALPFKLSSKVRARAEKFTKAVTSGVIKNGDTDIAMLENGRLKILPKTKKAAGRKDDNTGLTLKGNQNEGYTETEKNIASIYSEILGFKEIDIHDGFFELGGDSVLLTRMHVLIDKMYPDKVKLMDLFEHTSVSKLSRYISERDNKDKKDYTVNIKGNRTNTNDDVAVIGMAVKFPGADNIHEFWDNIVNYEDCMRDLPSDRKKFLDKYKAKFMGFETGENDYIKGGFLDGIDEFDYSFFKISPKEAALMEPGQRMLLQTVWQALEDSGYVSNISGSRTGVYIGFAASNYYQRMIFDVDPALLPISAVGNITAILPTRISYILDLKGPTMVLDTACSSSLVAVDLACQAMKNGYCDMAIAGGVRVNLMPLNNEHMKIGIESSDYRTWTFDSTADGAGMGEGIAAVILKPLQKAIEDRDNIYAVIRGSAVNQDGASIGITAPNPASQEDVLIRSWENSGVDPETITYIEAHGTATNLGDPIEIDGLTRAFERYTEKKQFCAISAVKTNIGHLYECAGIAGFVKAVLALKHKKLPPAINMLRPNPFIAFSESPVYINTALRDWETDGTPRRCGVSAFGLSGTNCHMVLEEAPAKAGVCDVCEEKTRIFVLTAKSSNVLLTLVWNYIEFLKENSNINLRDVCYSADTGRRHYNYRLAVIATNIDELISKLEKVFKNGLDLDEPDIFYGEYRLINENREFKSEFDINEKEMAVLSSEAEQKLQDYLTEPATQILPEICRLYVRGAGIGWMKLFDDEEAYRISLPVYPFERNKCWLEIPDSLYEEDSEGKKHEIPDNHMFFTMKWKEEPLPVGNDKDFTGRALVFVNENEKCIEVLEQLKATGIQTIEVRNGTVYENNGSSFIVSACQSDYDRMMEELADSKPDLIIHMMTIGRHDVITSIEELEDSKKAGVLSLSYLVRALANGGYTENIDMVLISDYVNEITGKEEIIIPENAMLFALSKVVSREHLNLRCRNIDIDGENGALLIVNEILDSSGASAAYRQGKRFTGEFAPFDMDGTLERRISIKEDGVYIITGGTGGIGLEMAKYLSGKNNKAKLALINRRPFPEKHMWDSILNENKNEILSQKIGIISGLEAAGTQVELISADVTSMEDMRSVLDNLRQRFGKINGVIHGAGFAMDATLMEKKDEDFKKVLAPKVNGTWIIDRLTENDNMDFMVVFSSVATMFGTINQSDYSAANAYLDSFAEERNKRGKPTVAINWTTWKETGMAANAGFTIDTIFKALTTKKAVSAFDTAFLREVGKVLIGEINYDGGGVFLLERAPLALSEEIRNKIEKFKNKRSGKLKSRNVKPAGEVVLTGRNDSSYTAIEKAVAEKCRQILGFSEIDIYDNFFELGADSILLMKIHAEIDSAYPGVITAVEMFEYTTVSKLAKVISERQDEAEKPGLKKITAQKQEDIESRIDEALKQMENGNISMDELIKALSND